MTKPTVILGALSTLGALLVAPARAADTRTFTVDARASRALVDVGKGGAFGFIAGHVHEVEAPVSGGVIHLDPADPSHADVRLEFDAATLRVTGRGEPAEDVPKVQQVMLGDQVLDVRRYPGIVFESTAVSAKGSPAALALSVTGTLSLHGSTRQLTAPVVVTVRGDILTATGRLSIKQTDYGIKPVSVAGVVTVKDAVNITFTIVARER